MGSGGQRHVAAALPPGKTLGTHRTSGCIGPSDCLDGCENLLHTVNRSPDRPAPSESLYRLRYSGPKRKKGSADFPKSTGEDAHADSICDAVLGVISKQRKCEFQNSLSDF